MTDQDRAVLAEAEAKARYNYIRLTACLLCRTVPQVERMVKDWPTSKIISRLETARSPRLKVTPEVYWWGARKRDLADSNKTTTPRPTAT